MGESAKRSESIHFLIGNDFSQTVPNLMCNNSFKLACLYSASPYLTSVIIPWHLPRALWRFLLTGELCPKSILIRELKSVFSKKYTMRANSMLKPCWRFDWSNAPRVLHYLFAQEVIVPKFDRNFPSNY